MLILTVSNHSASTLHKVRDIYYSMVPRPMLTWYLALFVNLAAETKRYLGVVDDVEKRPAARQKLLRFYDLLPVKGKATRSIAFGSYGVSGGAASSKGGPPPRWSGMTVVLAASTAVKRS